MYVLKTYSSLQIAAKIFLSTFQRFVHFFKNFGLQTKPKDKKPKDSVTKYGDFFRNFGKNLTVIWQPF